MSGNNQCTWDIISVNLLENERGPMNDQDLTKTDYDPDRSLVLIEGLSYFLTNCLQNLASCQTSLKHIS
jgi:hypothetical protein